MNVWNSLIILHRSRVLVANPMFWGARNLLKWYVILLRDLWIVKYKMATALKGKNRTPLLSTLGQ
jgi:hypothetical protein